MSIGLCGVRTHGFASIDVEIPHRAITAVVGASGSGKTSLLIHTLHSESLRRLASGVSNSDRRLIQLGVVPEFERIENLLPTVWLEDWVEKLRAQLAIYDFLQLRDFLARLFKRYGRAICPNCQRENDHQSDLVEGSAASVAAAIARAQQKGRIPTDSQLLIIAEYPTAFFKHSDGSAATVDRLLTFLESCFANGYRRFLLGGALVRASDGLSEVREALKGLAREQLELGVVLDTISMSSAIDLARLRESIALTESFGAPVSRIICWHKDAVSEDLPGWVLCEGMYCPSCGGNFSEFSADAFYPSIRNGTCDVCAGSGAGESAELLCECCMGSGVGDWQRSAILFGRSFVDWLSASASSWHAVLSSSKHDLEREGRELVERLELLLKLKLGELPLLRLLSSLSDGELYRLALAHYKISSLVDTVLILDSPQRYISGEELFALSSFFGTLTESGSTVVVAGSNNSPALAFSQQEIQLSLDGKTGQRSVDYCGSARAFPELATLDDLVSSVFTEVVDDASKQEALDLIAECPITAVVGSSGSGKTRFLLDVLYPEFRAQGRKQTASGKKYGIQTARFIDGSLSVAEAKQMLAEYFAVTAPLSEFFASQAEARRRGVSAEHFSTKSALGSCPSCLGSGVQRVELSFVGAGSIPCERCLGKRFTPLVLSVEYQSLSIADALELSPRIFQRIFSRQAELVAPFYSTADFGLDSYSLGQLMGSLSDGAKKRAAVARALGDNKRNIKKGESSLWLLDQPFSGLGAQETESAMRALKRAADQGQRFVIATANPGTITAADALIYKKNALEAKLLKKL